jgi:alkanesulfonate monooxygenase SsuD/methylene tetrahydromethanopterin reductase-like flavin-dependent oxidoreductase (luciferase family)
MELNLLPLGEQVTDPVTGTLQTPAQRLGAIVDFLTTRGPAPVGRPDGVADRLNTSARVLGADTNLVYLDMGGQLAGEYYDMVELIGARVIPSRADEEYR